MENLIDTREEIEIIKSLSAILSNEKFARYIDDIWELIYENKVTKQSINKVLEEHEIKNISEIKRELIELIFIINRSFIKIHSTDLSQSEVNFVRKKLMRLFSIDESDLYTSGKDKVAKILHPELEKIYFNNIIEPIESIYKVKLQEIFGLSYDQFLEFANIEDAKSIERGADLIDLDTVYFINSKLGRISIN